MERFKNKAAATAMALAALLLFGCSPKKESSPPTKQQNSQTNIASATKTNFTPPPLESIEPDTNAVPDWVPPEVLKQFADLKAKAEKGDAQAQFELDTNFWLTTPNEAVKWLLKAAEQDYTQACLYVGFHFSAVHTEAYDAKKGFDFFLRGARLGDTACAFYTGSGYLFGNGTTTNVEEGIRWVRKSADAGNESAQSSLACRPLTASRVSRASSTSGSFFSQAS